MDNGALRWDTWAGRRSKSVEPASGTGTQPGVGREWREPMAMTCRGAGGAPADVVSGLCEGGLVGQCAGRWELLSSEIRAQPRALVGALVTVGSHGSSGWRALELSIALSAGLGAARVTASGENRLLPVHSDVLGGAATPHLIDGSFCGCPALSMSCLLRVCSDRALRTTPLEFS